MSSGKGLSMGVSHSAAKMRPALAMDGLASPLSNRTT